MTEWQEKARDALYERIHKEAGLAATSTDGLKTLAEAYASVTYGPQGAIYEYENHTDYRYTSDVTHHEGENHRHRQAGFRAEDAERALPGN